MSSMAFLFLVVLVIVVICVIIKKIKDAEAEREAEYMLYELERKKASSGSSSSSYTPPEKRGTEIPSVIHGPKHEKPPEKEPPQITIYAYRSTGNSRICVICDGENEKGASHCRICGNQLH